MVYGSRRLNALGSLLFLVLFCKGMSAFLRFLISLYVSLGPLRFCEFSAISFLRDIDCSV